MRFTGIAAGGLTLALLLMPHVAVAETLEQLVQQGSAALEAKKYADQFQRRLRSAGKR